MSPHYAISPIPNTGNCHPSFPGTKGQLFGIGLIVLPTNNIGIRSGDARVLGFGEGDLSWQLLDIGRFCTMVAANI